MFRSVRRFANSPLGRRVLVWAAPLVVGWIVSKLQSGSQSESGKAPGRKSVRNKAK